MLMIFSMQRPDVVSWGDLAIRRGMMTLYGLKDLTGSNSMSIGNAIHPMDPLPPIPLGYIQRIGEPTLGYSQSIDALLLHSRIMINETLMVSSLSSSRRSLA